MEERKKLSELVQLVMFVTYIREVHISTLDRDTKNTEIFHGFT